MTDPTPPRAARSDAPLISACFLTVMAAEVAHLYAGWETARHLGHAGMLAAVLASIRRLGFREAYLLTLCAVLTGLILWLHDAPRDAMLLALDQGAFLMAFVLLIGLLQEGARTSPSVSRLGLYLSQQPPGRRFVALFTGAQALNTVFNLGAVSLLAPLIKKGVDQARDDPLTPVRERRQLSALLRGFAWSVVWSPTAVAPVAVAALIPGVDRGRWIVMGVAISVLMLLVGWAEDRIRFRALIGRGGPRQAQPFPWPDAGSFLLVCLSLAALTGLAMALGGVGVVGGLILAAPLLLIGWLVAQTGGIGPEARRTIGARLRQIGVEGMAGAAPVAVTLACSGYVGRAAAALIPVEAWAAAIGLNDVPAHAFLICLSLAVVALGQFALSPIMMAVFFGSLLGALPSLPADPTLTALAIACGWSLSMTSSPFATVVLFLNRITGLPGTTLTWRWNTGFTALTAAVLWAVFIGLTGGT